MTSVQNKSFENKLKTNLIWIYGLQNFAEGNSKIFEFNIVSTSVLKNIFKKILLALKTLPRDK